MLDLCMEGLSEQITKGTSLFINSMTGCDSLSPTAFVNLLLIGQTSTHISFSLSRSKVLLQPFHDQFDQL